jgi:hypothetical protein
MIKKLFAMIIIAALFLSVFANIACAQSVYGKILRNGQPAQHVLVIFSRGQTEVARAITGNDGYYFINSLPEGTYRVTIVYKGGSRTYSVTTSHAGGKYDFSI